MPNDGRQKGSRHPTRAKKKCDRLKPCGFCSARGVPELCRYTVISRPPAPDEAQFVSPSSSSKDSYDEVETTSPMEFLDQIGYSASRRRALEAIDEHPPGSALSNTNGNAITAIVSTSMYRSSVSNLPPVQLSDTLIDAHFSVENWSFPILDEYHFRDLYKQFRSPLEKAVSPDSVTHTNLRLAAFPALLFAVLASALQFVVPDSDLARTMSLTTTSQCVRLSQQYLSLGQETIKLFERQTPTTTSIEFYLMKMAWLKNCGRGGEAWQCLGVALRQAQEIDLHQLQDVSENIGSNPEDTLLQMWETEYKKRLWARIFIMDSHMAVGLGRPRGIHREDCSTSVPLDCDYPQEPSRTIPVSTNHSRQPPNIFSPVIFSIALSHKYHDLMTLRASKIDLKDYSRIAGLHNDVESMLTELPPALRPSFPDLSWDVQKPQLPIVRQRLLTTANIFLLALHRPYISTHVPSRDAAIEAGLTILQAQQTLFEMVPQAQHKMYGYSFYTIDASILVTVIIRRYPTFISDVSTRTLHELQQACARLSCMADRSVIAKAGEAVVRRCCGIVEASLPSPISNLSNSYLTETPSTTDSSMTDLLKELGYQSPDQTTREMFALLHDASFAQNSFPTDLVPGLDDMFPQNVYMPTHSSITNKGFVYPDVTTDSVWK